LIFVKQLFKSLHLLKEVKIMSSELMNTKETAKYLGIHEKQVYLLIKAGRIPCTKVTGKWIFPRKLIDEWIQTSAQNFFNRQEKNK